jgi:WD40 repeat protein
VGLFNTHFIFFQKVKNCLEAHQFLWESHRNCHPRSDSNTNPMGNLNKLALSSMDQIVVLWDSLGTSKPAHNSTCHPQRLSRESHRTCHSCPDSNTNPMGNPTLDLAILKDSQGMAQGQLGRQPSVLLAPVAPPNHWASRA